MSDDNVLVTTVNTVGAMFQLTCVILYIAYAEKSKKRLVIRTKSVEFMPFYLSLSTFAMSVCFMLYGIFNFDPFVYIPNGIGTILGTVQLALFLYYERKDTDHSREPLIESFP
ncbi:Bidirectional sugar transporter SWEET3a [Heracleum sosnowskyi]|uniref:Bidirectional sugar transporter SWEET3a n=1 Tax=Heracleum sosnowskyi TaxID=360622 RepID=A0AAD8LXA2_9APIA|nr:Bidirectional sugar transporter SWEET3a [Heracleum sosnowskyi]